MSDHECEHGRRGECPDCRAKLEAFLSPAPLDEKARRRQLAAKIARETPFTFDECRAIVDEADGEELLARGIVSRRLQTWRP